MFQMKKKTLHLVSKPYSDFFKLHNYIFIFIIHHTNYIEHSSYWTHRQGTNNFSVYGVHKLIRKVLRSEIKAKVFLNKFSELVYILLKSISASDMVYIEHLDCISYLPFPGDFLDHLMVLSLIFGVSILNRRCSCLCIEIGNCRTSSEILDLSPR